MVKGELCRDVVEVGRVSDGVMTLVVFEENVLRLICGYAPQSGGSFEEKQSFYDVLKCEWDVHFADDLVMCLGDFNGHVGSILMGLWRTWCRSEDFVRKDVITVLSGK